MPLPSPSTFAAGAAVEVFLGREAAGRSAFAPLDAFNRFEIVVAPAPSLVSVTTEPGMVRKEYAIESGGTLTAVWQALSGAARPWPLQPRDALRAVLLAAGGGSLGCGRQGMITTKITCDHEELKWDIDTIFVNN